MQLTSTLPQTSSDGFDARLEIMTIIQLLLGKGRKLMIHWSFQPSMEHIATINNSTLPFTKAQNSRNRSNGVHEQPAD